MRILNPQGKEKYKEWVASVKNGIADRNKPPHDLLAKGDTSLYCAIDTKWEVPAAGISKYDFSVSLIPLIEEFESNRQIDNTNLPLLYDTLALLSFPIISPPDSKNLYGLEFYCYNENSQRRYRHRILGPVTLVRTGGDSVKEFFRVEPHVMGEYESNIGSRQQIAGNKYLLESLAALYTRSKTLKKGYTTTYKPKGFPKKVGKEGTIRRFGEITNQLTRIYDIYEMESRCFLNLLPQEFSPWIGSKC